MVGTSVALVIGAMTDYSTNTLPGAGLKDIPSKVIATASGYQIKASMNTKPVRGDKLPDNLKRQVLAAYVYRLTIENGYPQRNPCKARVPAISDAQWLAEHTFHVTTRGTLDARQRHAEQAFMAD